MIRILRAILSAFGITKIRSYTTCEAALNGLLDQPPDLVLTDWRMEPVNGLQFIRNLRHRTMGALAFTAVVMISGHASSARVKRAMLAGANQFLVKPVSPAALLARLEWAVRDERPFVLKGDHYVIDGIEEYFSSMEKKSRGTGQQNAGSTPQIAGKAADGADLTPPPGETSPPNRQESFWEL